jgi:hypothetical protein
MKIRLLLVAAIALVALTGAATGATAFTGMSIAPGGTTDIVTEGTLTFTAETIRIRCEPRFGLEVRRGPFGNRRGEVFGRANIGQWSRCAGGEIVTFLALFWSIQVENILGGGESTAPEMVTGLLVTFVRFRIQIEALTLRCLYEGNLGMLFPLTRIAMEEHEGRRFYLYSQGRLRLLATDRLPLISGPGSCPANMTIAGSFRPMSPAQTFTFW